ncbi:MAG: NUDIX hydrolase [Lachnospiraceae bacterium]|nr:NUDIX hydrolase [Lachnospiraceae bacterium]MBP3608717.1 NUDIX hydrolase [Lachnospiraceae bacterium]
MKPVIHKENVKPLFESRFIKVYDLQYGENKHYFDATRRPLSNLMAVKSEEEFKHALPDAVTCVVILTIPGEEPKLLLDYEFRYPAGQFLLSPPAGLLDPEDVNSPDPLLATAKREIEEETGLLLAETDRLFTINPLLFSTPGMTDESNALVCAVIQLDDTSSLTQAGAVGSECFDGFELLTKEEARTLLKNGRDSNGIFYSVFTWAALMYFVSDLWY